MRSNREHLLKVLKTELRFLENGGYRNPDMWRPQFIFLDSPTCVHPLGSDRPAACGDCPLIGFVPRERRNAAIPCHHIPLTKEGFTVDGLSRWGTQEETENALRNWLVQKIAALSGKEESEIQDQAQPSPETEAFRSYLAG